MHLGNATHWRITSTKLDGLDATFQIDNRSYSNIMVIWKCATSHLSQDIVKTHATEALKVFQLLNTGKEDVYLTKELPREVCLSLCCSDQCRLWLIRTMPICLWGDDRRYPWIKENTLYHRHWVGGSVQEQTLLPQCVFLCCCDCTDWGSWENLCTLVHLFKKKPN